MGSNNLTRTPERATCAFGLFYWSKQMLQRDLNREVANQTGESIHTINAMGFSPLREVIPIEERHKPLIVDWDLQDQLRNLRSTNL